MSFNGSGTFNINTAGQPVVTGTTITATAFNLLTADLANGLSTCLTKDGQTTVTANIPFAGFKITGVGLATTSGDALSYGQAATVGNLNVVGTTGTSIASFSRSTNALQRIAVTNSNAGNAAQASIALSNGTSDFQIIQYGTGVSTSAPWVVANGSALTGGTGGLALGTANASNITFVYNNASVGDWNATRFNVLTPIVAPSINFGGSTLSTFATGSWTPADASGAGLSFTSVNATYTRIGNLVIANCFFVYPATADGSNALISGLPFTSRNIASSQQGGVSFTSDQTNAAKAFVGQNTQQVFVYTNASVRATNAQLSGDTLSMQFIYETT